MVGSGNVAAVLGRLIQKNGHRVIQVMSRNAEKGRSLANELSCAFTSIEGNPDNSANLFLLALSDDGIYTLQENLFPKKGVIVHTAGAVPMDLLKKICDNYGVLYPLQSLRREITPSFPVPFLVDGNNPETISLVEDFALTISANVKRGNDEERLKLHVAAVIVSNFTNHLYTLAEEFCKKEKVDFDLLIPLIEETARRLATHSPQTMQTGPAIRHDIHTVEKHLSLLRGYPGLKNIYLKLTESIMNR